MPQTKQGKLTPKILANNLKARRKLLGITQKEAAIALGLPRTAITQIENGNRNISTLEIYKLSILYKCWVEDFFYAAN
jgi:transcriptional regulator with XRE-family HTH domain